MYTYNVNSNQGVNANYHPQNNNQYAAVSIIDCNAITAPFQKCGQSCSSLKNRISAYAKEHPYRFFFIVAGIFVLFIIIISVPSSTAPSNKKRPYGHRKRSKYSGYSYDYDYDYDYGYGYDYYYDYYYYDD